MARDGCPPHASGPGYFFAITYAVHGGTSLRGFGVVLGRDEVFAASEVSARIILAASANTDSPRWPLAVADL